MKNKKELYLQYAQSPVYLNEELHVYIHKQTGKIYNSVTGALALIEDTFDDEKIIPALITQHENFLKWYDKAGGSPSFLPELFLLYRTYQKDRPFVRKKWDGNEYNAYKKLSEYKSIEELHKELKKIEGQNPTKPKDKIYLRPDLSVMNVKEIKQQWYWLNKLAQDYGNVVHLSIEDRFLSVQGLIDIDERSKKLADIQTKFNNLEKTLSEVDMGFNSHHYKPYSLDCDALEFRDYIEIKYDEVRLDYGMVTIPENIVFTDRWDICGTSDQKPILDDKTFNVNDYKTNKKYTFESEYGKKLLPPFENMENCEHTKHVIQLNMYANIEEDNSDMSCKDMNVIYWAREKQMFSLIPIERKESEAKKLLDIHLEVQTSMVDKYRTSGILGGVDEKYHIYISKLLKRDIEYRKNKGLILESKAANRTYYIDFINKEIQKVQKILRR